MHASSRLLAVSILSALASLAWSPEGKTGNFGVSPLDVQFSPQRKSAVLTVSSDDPKPVSLRLQAMRWTQDEKGVDKYEPTDDIVFFPKRLDLKSGDRKIARLGVTAVGASEEHAYRLFIEEIAPAETPKDAGTKLAVLVSVGVPVFVTPGGFEPQLRVASATLDKSGQLQMTVNNAGKSRVRISRIASADGATLSDAIASRYVFPGVSKQFEIASTGTPCKGGSTALGVDAGGKLESFDARCTN